MTKAKRAAIRQRLYDLQGRRCCYCRRYMYLDFSRGSVAATIEHLKRKRDGGTDHPDNLAVACLRCNSTRGDRSWVEFATLMQQVAA